MQYVEFQDLGLVDYQQAWDYQQELLREVIEIKLFNRDKDASVSTKGPKHYLLFCEHPPVYTLGRSGSISNLLLDESQLRSKSIDFYKINRGGDITYHGPGQIVGYPILDLDKFFTDVHKYVRYIEEVIIRTLSDYGLDGYRIPGFTGVWLQGGEDRVNRKICAIGVHLSRWVTMHGFAFNINTDLDFFKNIIPCGIEDGEKEVTSLSKELGTFIDMKEVKSNLKRHFSNVFEFKLVETEP